MEKADATEATGVVTRALTNLLKCIVPTSSTAAQARSAVGALIADANALLAANAIGPPLQSCFSQVQQTGATWQQIDQVREWVTLETPATLGGELMQNALVYECLAFEALIVSSMTFTSREDVETLQQELLQPFQQAEETAADDMHQMSYQAMIGLQAALTNFLSQTAMPLPWMANYQFAAVLPSLVIAQRLYADASRADQIVAENKIVHPAFCPPTGEALSF